MMAVSFMGGGERELRVSRLGMKCRLVFSLWAPRLPLSAYFRILAIEIIFMLPYLCLLLSKPQNENHSNFQILCSLTLLNSKRLLHSPYK